MFLFIISAFIVQHAWAQVGMGPLNLDLIQAKTCDGDTGVAKFEVVSMGDKKGLNIDIDIPYEFDETFSYTARVDKIQNGQIQEGIFRHGGENACADLAKFLGDLWANLLEATGMPTECPKAAGHYKTEEFEVKEEDIAVDKFLYGRFLLNLELSRAGDKIVCAVLEFTNNRPGESV